MKESGMGKQFTKRALGGAILATVLPASAGADLVSFVLGAPGQDILRKYGFH
jgi:hypothetical protein